MKIGRPIAFTVRHRESAGRLEACVLSPSGTKEAALVQAIDRDQFAVRFLPREPGPHLIHVWLANVGLGTDDRLGDGGSSNGLGSGPGQGADIPGSPFRILVDRGSVIGSGPGSGTGRASTPADPSMVNASGQGLVQATVGKHLICGKANKRIMQNLEN
ncbi:unnamed protein product [Protopolystoma xenopodis]|uniref:Uncharacterized protein n=1 Tax=Protopolystoma xenopodis TaxID=117903 RepID=A0A448WI75_9PLAT|nr:unnamed protein product [Protopolystoma xenopodis]